MKTLPVLALLMLGSVFSGALAANDILADAEARIERYRMGEVVLRVIGPAGQPIPAGRRARIEQTRHKFLFGSNIFMLGKGRRPAEDAAYKNYFANLLNYATLPFYWWEYEPLAGQPNDAATEAIVAWCRGHNVTAKGHPLAWNWEDPAWLPTDPTAAMRLQLGRIGECVARFRGKVEVWDVVNEATHYDRPEPKAQAPLLTEAISRMGVRAYLRAAFKAARAANAKAVLVINDYRTDSAYAEKVISQLVDEAGRPLYDVIGIQSHQHSGAWPVAKIWEVCERFAVFGKPLHFTETTFLSGKAGWDLKKKDPRFKWESTPEGEQRQGEEVTRFYTVLFSHPAVEAITWWDFADQGAWQDAPAGLLRENMTPKPAYEALLRLIKGKWWTRAQVVVGANGEAKFRGFFGEYKITVDDAGRELLGTFSLDRAARRVVDVRLE